MLSLWVTRKHPSKEVIRGFSEDTSFREKEYNRAYYDRNKTLIRERKRLYYLRNKDKLVESNRKYYVGSQDNGRVKASRTKDARSHYLREYAKRNSRAQYLRDYYLQNKDTITECKSQNYKRNQANYREYRRQHYIRNKEYPEKYFRREIPIKSWKTPESVRTYLDSIANALMLYSHTDWYRVSRPQMALFGGMSALNTAGIVSHFVGVSLYAKFGNLGGALKYAYPEFEWDLNMFALRGKKSVQRWLKLTIEELLPGTAVVEDYQHPDLASGASLVSKCYGLIR
jgi:hypothetical protein